MAASVARNREAAALSLADRDGDPGDQRHEEGDPDAVSKDADITSRLVGAEKRIRIRIDDLYDFRV